MNRADAPEPTADGPRRTATRGVADTVAGPARAARATAVSGTAAPVPATSGPATAGADRARVLSPFDPRVTDWARAVSVPVPRPGGRGS